MRSTVGLPSRFCAVTSTRAPGTRSERSLVASRAGDRFQFERHGYFVADLVDHGSGGPVFNRTATLRDTWSR